MNDSRGLAPNGWHIASDEEWSVLTEYLGGEEIAGAKLKEEDIAHWNPPNTGATNESGFSALPGGWRYDAVFDFIEYYGNWWTSTDSMPTDAWLRRIRYDNTYIFRYSNDKFNGFSVRCLKD